MPLFIFNSKYRLITGTVITFFVLILAYEYFISSCNPKSKPEDEFHTNIALAQEYLYHGRSRPVVLVGSSFSLRLRSFMSEECALLALSGGTPITGLEIIERSQALPSVVLVEVSHVLERDADEDLIASLFIPGLWQLRSRLPSLQEKNRPVSVLVEAVEEAVLRVRSKSGEAMPHPPKGVDVSAFNILFQEQKKLVSGPLNHAVLDKNINRMFQLLEKIRARGGQPVFFETPVHPEIADSTWMTSIRQKFTHTFPKEHYIWIPRPDHANYQTTDGTHLTSESASEFCIELKKSLFHLGLITNP